MTLKEHAILKRVLFIKYLNPPQRSQAHVLQSGHIPLNGIRYCPYEQTFNNSLKVKKLTYQLALSSKKMFWIPYYNGNLLYRNGELFQHKTPHLNLKI